MPPLTIGQLARHAGIGVETVRFYERRGLIDDPPRRSSGYRQYPPEVVDQLRFIRRARELGFSLEEIAELLELRGCPPEERRRVRARVRAKAADLRERINQLQSLESALIRLADACEHAPDDEPCPILAALDGNEDNERSEDR